jgi:hypothetical protein
MCTNHEHNSIERDAESDRTAPWRTRPVRLVSWWDVKAFDGGKLYIIAILLERTKDEDLKPLVAQAVLSADRRTMIEMTLRFVERECVLLGLGDSAGAVFECRNDLLALKHFQMTREQVLGRIEEIDRAIQRELKRQLFLYVASDRAGWYQNPTKDWEEVVKRWPPMRDDIEESAKCFACDRYAAAVFHVMLVAEAGAIEIGELIQIGDPKRGWNSVLREIDRILHKTKFADLKLVEQQHFKMLEQLWPLMQGMRDAWRHKISHVENKAVLLTGEFSPQIAEDIIVATRAFMRRLAVDMPV